MIEAARFYETRRAGLGDQFLDCLTAGLTQIQRHPCAWRKIRGEVRRRLLKRFPYGIIYVPGSQVIHVVTIMHLSREPDYWMGRLSDLPGESQ